MRKKCTIPFFVLHKGCPFKCVFCDQNSITGDYVGDRPEEVEKKVQEYLKTMDPARQRIQVGFFGGSFTGIPLDEQISFLRPLKKFISDGSISGVRLSTRPDYIYPENLDILQKHGVTTIELGVQSASDKVLELSRRGHTHQDICTSSVMIKDFGFDLVHQMMLGLPGSDHKEELFTATEAVRLGASEARIYPLIVLEGTPLSESWKNGEYEALSEEEAVSRATHVWLLLLDGGVDVIRCGLHASKELIDGNKICDGPFHPAFGSKVRSNIYSLLLEKIAKVLKGAQAEQIVVNPSEGSELRGFSKMNIEMLRGILRKKDIAIDNELPRFHIKVVVKAGEGFIVGPGDLL